MHEGYRTEWLSSEILLESNANYVIENPKKKGFASGILSVNRGLAFLVSFQVLFGNRWPDAIG